MAGAIRVDNDFRVGLVGESIGSLSHHQHDLVACQKAARSASIKRLKERGIGAWAVRHSSLNFLVGYELIDVLHSEIDKSNLVVTHFYVIDRLLLKNGTPRIAHLLIAQVPNGYRTASTDDPITKVHLSTWHDSLESFIAVNKLDPNLQIRDEDSFDRL